MSNLEILISIIVSTGAGALAGYLLGYGDASAKAVRAINELELITQNALTNLTDIYEYRHKNKNH